MRRILGWFWAISPAVEALGTLAVFVLAGASVWAHTHSALDTIAALSALSLCAAPRS
jgi:hypothetical protein